MDGDKVILAYHGQWQGHIYRTKTESLIFWPVLKTSLDEFMDFVHSIVEADLTKYKYVLYCLVSVEDSQVKSRIFSTRDLHRAAKMLATPKFFVTLDWKKPPEASPPCNDEIPTVQRLQTSIVSRNKNPRPPSYRPPSTYYPPSHFHGPSPSSAPVAKSKAVSQPNKVAKVFEGQTARKNIDGGNHDEVLSDDEDKIILAHQGCWRGQIYKSAMESLIFLPLLKTSLDEFVDLVHRIVEADQTRFKYVLHCLLSHVKWRILSTQDLHRAAKMFKTPKFFVTLGDNQIPTVHHFPTCDDEDKVILAHHGDWKGQLYQSGMESLIFWPLLKTSFDEFVDLVHIIVEADQTRFSYVLTCVVSHEDSQVKWRIVSTQDLHRAAKMFKTPKFFVSLDWSHPTPSPPPNEAKSKASQGAFGDDQIRTSDDEDKIIVAYHGDWVGRKYQSGKETLVFWPLLKTSFDEFMDLVHRIVGFDQTIHKYVLHCLVSHEDSLVKWRMLSTQDLHRAAKVFKTPKFFVTCDWRLPTPSPPSNEVKSKASQGAFGDDQMAVNQPNKVAKVFEGQTTGKNLCGIDEGNHDEVSSDDEDKVIFAYNGDWSGWKYQYGTESLFFLPSLLKTSLDEFMDFVHRIVEADQTTFKYVLHCRVSNDDHSQVKSRILSTQDLHRAAKMFKTPKFFVTLDRLPTPSPPREVKSKSSQGAFGDRIPPGHRFPSSSRGLNYGKGNHDEVSSDDDRIPTGYHRVPANGHGLNYGKGIHDEVSSDDDRIPTGYHRVPANGHGLNYGKGNHDEVSSNNEAKSKASQGVFGDRIPTSGHGLNYGKGNHDEVSSDDEDYKNDSWVEVVRKTIYDNLGWEEDEYFIPEDVQWGRLTPPPVGPIIGGLNERVLRSRRIPMERTFEDWWPRVLSRLLGCGVTPASETVAEVDDETVVEVVDSWSACLKKSSV